MKRIEKNLGFWLLIVCTGLLFAIGNEAGASGTSFISGQGPEGVCCNGESRKLSIGQTEQTYKLDETPGKVSGMAFKMNDSGEWIYLLDAGSKKIMEYKVNSITNEITYAGSIALKDSKIVDPRGLAWSEEFSHDVFYFTDYYKAKNAVVSRLYRFDVNSGKMTFSNLTDGDYDIGTKEVFGVAVQHDCLYISFDPSDYTDQVERIRQGIVRISIKNDESPAGQADKKSALLPADWALAVNGNPVIKKHMPGPGKTIKGDRVEASRSLAAMSIDGTNYLWGTVGNSNIYLIDSESGRGIFFFDMPRLIDSSDDFHTGMAFGAGHLWVVEPDCKEVVVHRVNVLENPELAYAGPKRFRELRMRLVSNVREDVKTPRGYIYHTFLQPFPNSVLGRQDVIQNSVHTNDLTNVADCSIERLSYNPADDPASTQDYVLATYNADLHPDIRKYATDYSVKLWTREYKNFIYPHLVVGDSGPEGTRYLEDDDILYKYTEDPKIYKAFMQRVKDYIVSEYNIDPRMDNPYWVARNITEYIKENYHYPKDEEGYFATYDFVKGNYNSNPGNLKADLSADDNYADNITACSGTGAMVCGALRYSGIPATWIGVSQEQNWKGWNTEDDDEFLEFNEESVLGNGHRYNHVWLGEFYKWQRFDATPTRPDGIEFDKKPREVSQWDLMLRSASGVEPHRVIHTIQSEFWDKLHVAFADCDEHVNNCGATRYNLLGTYTYPQDFYFSNNIIRARAIQFVDDVKINLGEDKKGVVTWLTSGEWNLDPDAKLEVILEKKADSADADKYPSGYIQIRHLASGIPAGMCSLKVDLTGMAPGTYRVKITKTGDPMTGNASLFEIAK